MRRCVTNTASLSFVLAFACSQRAQSNTETTEALGGMTASSTTAGASAPGATPPPAGTVTPVATSVATPPSPPAGASASTPDSKEPPSTTADASPPEPEIVCVPAEPTVIPCTDDLNTDEPQTPCSQWVEWGTCDESWMLERHVCDRSCGRCTEDQTIPPTEASICTGATPPASTEATSMPPVFNTEGPKLPPLDGGEAGFTTRYWDCCKPHCGWPGNSSRPVNSCDQGNGNMGGNHDAASACSGGPAHMCWNFVPVTNGDNIAYAFAAHNGVGCGTCFQFDFTGESHNPKPDTGHDLGSQSLAGKSMIVQVINTGGIEAGQFDILVPGGGVGDFDACSSQWGTSELGERYGGFFLACQKEHNFEYEPSRQCARDWCERVFTGKDDLLRGCTWFVEWFGLADNPTMKYKEVPCPQELTAISGM